MEAIPRLIFNMLARHQRVALPGIGTLYTERKPVSVDASGLTGPRTRILFSPLVEKAEALPELIALQSGIPIKEIKSQYNRWVSRLKNASTDGELAIKDVVLLIRQPDGSFWVEPSRELESLLNPIQPSKILSPVLPSLKGKKRSALPKREGKKKSTQKVRAAWLAIGGAVLAILIYAGYYAFTRGFFDSHEPPVVSIEPVIENPEILSSLPDSTQLADSVAPIPQETQVVEEPALIPANSTGEVYHIIVGVFSTLENVERYVGQNTFDASRITIIPTTNGRFMVSVGKYVEKQEALKEMSRFRKDHPQVWVSKREE